MKLPSLAARFLKMYLLFSAFLIAVSMTLAYQTNRAYEKAFAGRTADLMGFITVRAESFLKFCENRLTAFTGPEWRWLLADLDHARDFAYDIEQVVVMDLDGTVRTASPPAPNLIGTNMSGHDFIRRARSSNEIVWSNAFFSPFTNAPAVMLARRTETGIVALQPRLGEFLRIAKAFSSSEKDVFAVVDSHGVLVTHSFPSVNDNFRNLLALSGVEKALKGELYQGPGTLEGEAGMVTAIPMKHMGWMVLGFQPEREAAKYLQKANALLVGTLCGAIAFTAVLAILLFRSLLSPLVDLRKQIRALEEGKNVEHLHCGFAELEDLGRHFCKMAQTVRQRERTLQESETSYATLVHNIPDYLSRFDRDGRFVFANESLLQKLNCSMFDVLGKTFENLGIPSDTSEELRQAIKKVFATGQPLANEVIIRDSIYSCRWIPEFSHVGETQTVLHVARDITEARKIEASARTADKLQAIGGLASGVAHDFNNQLTGIIGATELLAEDPLINHGHRELNIIRRCADRAADLIAKLLAFARQRPYNKGPTCIHELIHEVMDIVSRSFPKSIALTTDLDATHTIVRGDSSQLQNAIFNIAINARDAMPRGGTLKISTKSVLDSESPPAGHLILEIADTGCGMSPEIKSRVFDPFFTTKDVGKGTGLGLTTVYGTIAAHDGEISVDSAPEKGTRFMIKLPLEARQKDQAEQAFIQEKVLLPASLTAMVVDDEEAVREIVVAALEKLGVKAVEFSNGTSAREFFQKSIGPVDLVILDGNMPGLTGRETWDAISARAPELPVIFTTGNLDVADLPNPRPANLHILEKPFGLQQFNTRVQQACSRILREALP